jgi:VWFA-related protein
VALRRLVAGAALGTAAVAILAAQEPGAKPPAPQDQRPPTFRTEANFVRVDVYPMLGSTAITDLRAEDFEVFEDTVRQSVQTFEHVEVRPVGPQSARVEPNSIGESRQMAANPRSRVFVVFLDTKHVSMEGSWQIREPLIRLIDRILGPDDLVGVMTSSMAASDVILARKTQVLEGGLLSIWPWGERFTLQKDERELHYEGCFPTAAQREVVAEMIARRRERMALEALHELMLYLRNLRDERKAILTISDGWLLYRENQGLMTLRIIDPTTGTQETMGGPRPIGTGPDGRLTMGNTRNNTSGVTLNDCWEDRQRLSIMDNDKYFRDELLGAANRANASFYTVDPRGLPVFDTQLSAPAPGIVADYQMLRKRQDMMRVLAENTDGLAVMNSNDLDAGLKRIADDLTSYYLLGYYSTNTKMDGRYRNITVKVKRPGVTVRARRGYRAATDAEIMSAKKAAAAPVPEIVTAMSSSMGALDRVRAGSPFYINAAPGPGAAAKGASTIWVSGELQPAGASDPWLKGGAADIEIATGGNTVTARATIAAGDRGFVVPVALPTPIESGTVEVRVRLTGTDPAARRAVDSISVDARQTGSRPLLFRRGPTTGNRLQPVATFHFNRSDRARLEVPLAADMKPGGGRVIDRAGQTLSIPVTVGERADPATGQRWMTADLTLAALAPADYAIEIAVAAPQGELRTVTAIRVSR